jgi:hypothetical protein
MRENLTRPMPKSNWHYQTLVVSLPTLEVSRVETTTSNAFGDSHYYWLTRCNFALQEFSNSGREAR